VARLYADAYQEGVSVQRQVADRLGVSIPTAARRIMLARDRGLISGRFNQTRGSRKQTTKTDRNIK
jgi:DNA-binding transcriptional regulator LsrR (DeoR family)